MSATSEQFALDEKQRKAAETEKKLKFDDLMKRRYFFSQGFEIYGGVAGLYDYGPPGCAVKNNLLKLWRDHFILEEDMLEISTTCITPMSVFKASVTKGVVRFSPPNLHCFFLIQGHVDRFTGLMVKDMKTGVGVRADRLVKDFIEAKLSKKKVKPEQVKELESILARVEAFNTEQMHQAIVTLGIKAPDTNNELSYPEPFNLMFATSIGPSGAYEGFLRPETAQGMFVNFNKLNEFNGGRIPFAAAQIGLGFRNEIAPRNGLYRVREFDMAEIEHFFDPQNADHPKFKFVKHIQLPLLTANSQESGDNTVVHMLLEDAVKNGVISNETHGYFVGRTYQFLVEAGVNKNLIRFRQHMSNEMAHYACDCWDAEIDFSQGYKECVGIANRSAYDLKQHSNASKTKLLAARRLPVPKKVTIVEIILDKKEIADTLNADGTDLMRHIEALSEEAKAELLQKFSQAESVEFVVQAAEKGTVETVEKKLSLMKTMVQFKVRETLQQEDKFVPHVIEPAFGVGRIFTAILEHNFHIRDQKRTFLSLPPKIAPFKCSILPVISHEKYDETIHKLKISLTKVGVSAKVDDSGHSIGKRYARTDEIGIPFGITVDGETLEDNTVTLREILTCQQIRIPIEKVFKVLQDLSDGVTTWEETLKYFPLFTSLESESATNQ